MNRRRWSGRCAAALVAALAIGNAGAADPVPPAPAATGTPDAATPAAASIPATEAPAAAPATVAPAAAPVQIAPPAAARAPGPVVGGSTSGMISGLIFLLALVLGAAWLVKRSGGMPALRGGGALRVVAALPLGPRERVVLIEMGGQQWLLGVGGGAVNVLHHFEQPIVAGGADDFAGKLRQFLPQAVGK